MGIGRKSTVWGARHIDEEKEIERIQKEAAKILGIRDVTKLEASKIVAERSSGIIWDSQRFINELRKLRGIE